MKNESIYTIYSIGHSTKPIEIFIGKLKAFNVDVLVDVRTIPFSRWMPHFNKIAIEKSLAKDGIAYLYRGLNLGGKGENTDYEQAIDELAGLVRDGKLVCVMCSEGKYLKCHRYTTLLPSLEERGLVMIHIEYEPEPK